MKIVIRIFTTILLIMGNLRGNMNTHSGKCDLINDITSLKKILKENEEAVSANTHLGS